MLLKGIRCLLLIVISLTLSGCLGIYEMKHQSFITAIGIDRTDEDKIKVAVMELSSKGSTANGESEVEKIMGNVTARVVSSTCEFFPHCIEKLKDQLTGRFIMDKVEFLILNEKIVAEGIERYIHYLLQLGQLEQTVNIFSTEQSIDQFLSNESGAMISELIKSIEFHPALYPNTLWQLAPLLYSDLESGAISTLSIIKKQPDIGNIPPQSEINVTGLDLLKKDKLGLHLTEEEAKTATLFFKKDLQTTTFMFAKERYAFRIRKHKIDVSVSEKEADARIYLEGWVLHEEKEETQNPELLQSIEETIAHEMKQKLDDILQRSQQEGVDLLGIGERLRQKNHDVSNWSEKIREFPITIHVDIEILAGYGI